MPTRDFCSDGPCDSQYEPYDAPASTGLLFDGTRDEAETAQGMHMTRNHD